MKHNTKMMPTTKHMYNQQQHQYRQNKRVVTNNNGDVQQGVGNNNNRQLQQQGGDSNNNNNNNSNNNNNNNKRTQHQQHNKNQQKKFSFPMVNKDIQKLMNQVIDSILKQRNTIILAKLAKDNLLPKHYFSTTINKSTSSTSLFALQSSSQSLMNKSLDEINHYYCTQISTKVVKKVVQYLKMSQLCAKVVSTGYIIDNLGSGFNFGGLTYWDYSSDGQKTVTRKLPQVGLLAEMKKNQTQQQQQQKQSSSSNMMVSEQAQQQLQLQQQQQFSQQYKQLQRDSLLIVTVYLLKYEQSFRASNN